MTLRELVTVLTVAEIGTLQFDVLEPNKVMVRAASKTNYGGVAIFQEEVYALASGDLSKEDLVLYLKGISEKLAATKRGLS